MSSTMTIRLDEETKARLEKLAVSTERSKAFLANEAIREYLDVNEWQIAEIHAALKESDAGQFAGDDEVTALKNKWLGNAD